MAKIPFDIKFRPQIESGKYKVVTGDDRPAWIISWDKKIFGGRIEIAALVPTSQGDTATVQLYRSDGTLIASGWNEKFKLFIITPDPQLTEWQTFISGCLQKHGLLDCGAADRIAKECSAELLDLARKELEPEFPSIIEARSFRTGYERGKEDALKDFPRWKKAKEYIKLEPDDYCFTLDNDGKMSPYWATEIEKGQYFITESDLEKLPKED